MSQFKKLFESLVEEAAASSHITKAQVEKHVNSAFPDYKNIEAKHPNDPYHLTRIKGAGKGAEYVSDNHKEKQTEKLCNALSSIPGFSYGSHKRQFVFNKGTKHEFTTNIRTAEHNDTHSDDYRTKKNKFLVLQHEKTKS